MASYSAHAPQPQAEVRRRRSIYNAQPTTHTHSKQPSFRSRHHAHDTTTNHAHQSSQRPTVKRGRPGQGGDEDVENRAWHANTTTPAAGATGAKPRLPSCLVGAAPEIVATGACVCARLSFCTTILFSVD